MSTWKKTYVITALCLIVAGIIYLSLPISREGSYRKNIKENKFQTENTLYRINENNIETVDDSYTGDSYLIKATTTVNDGQAYLANTGTFQAGYLRSHPVTDTSGVAVGVNVTNNEEIRIPKAKFNTSRATVSVASAGYIPKGEVVGSINSYTGDTTVTPGMNPITL